MNNAQSILSVTITPPGICYLVGPSGGGFVRKPLPRG